jgi:hypothetical protein
VSFKRIVLVAGALAVGVAIGIPGVEAASKVYFAQNAGTVNGIRASRSPQHNQLLPLNNSGRINPKVLPPYSNWLSGGQTVTGVIGGSFTATAANQPFTTTASFPIASRTSIAVENTGILGSAQENPYCSGSETSPTAPQGILCIYPASEQFLNVAQDCTPGPFPNCTKGEGVFKVSFQSIQGNRNGFAVTWLANAAGQTSFYGTWAYTARVKGQTPGAGGGAAGGGND